MQLREYQREAIEAAYQEYREGNQAALVVLPTGAGKTPVIATVAKDFVSYGERVVVLAHVKELLAQSVEKLEAIAPGLPVGIFSAGLGSKDTGQDVLVSGIQSVYNQASRLGKRDLVIVDECHRIPEDDQTRYKIFLSELMLENPDLKILGLTATPYRMDAGLIYGEGQLFPKVCYEAGIAELIGDGYLSRLKNRNGSTLAIPDLKGVGTRGGDYVASELAERVDQDELVEALVHDVFIQSVGRKSVLVFAVSVAHAHRIWQRLLNLGEVAGVVTGETESPERAKMLAQFKSGEIRFLINVMVLTEGFDAPNIDCVVLARPTQSAGLYYQMVGRGFRLGPGKVEGCLVLDYGRNITRHGPVDSITVKRKGKGESQEARAKECPKCGELCAVGVRLCPDCGHAFPDPERTMPGAEADQESPILSPKYETPIARKVRFCNFNAHTKKDAPEGAPKTLRVIYGFGVGEIISEFICVEHPPGYAKNKAKTWWGKRCRLPMPESAEEAARLGNAGCFAEPMEVLVQEVKGSKWPELKGVKLGEIPVAEAPLDDDFLNALQSVGNLNDLPF